LEQGVGGRREGGGGGADAHQRGEGQRQARRGDEQGGEGAEAERQHAEIGQRGLPAASCVGQRAHDRADSHGRGQRAEGPGPGVKLEAGHQREQDREIEGQRAYHGHGRQGHQQRGLRAHVTQALA